MSTFTKMSATDGNSGVVNGNIMAKDKLEKELESLNRSLISLNSETSRNRKSETEIQLQEKKSICLLKLKKYQEVVEDGYRTIGKKGPSVVIFKCILAALCRMRKYDDVHEALDQWKRLTPKDVMMIETKLKVERILSAIRSGMKPEEVFKNLEQSLGLNSEWIYRKAITTNGNFKFRPPPNFSTTFFMCPRGQTTCMFGDKCIGAHSVEELAEWKQRLELRNKNWEITRTNLTRPNGSLQYLIDITKRINETTNIRKLLADEIPGVKFKCADDLKRTCYERNTDLTWQMLIVTRSPLRTISLLHDVHRSNFWISAASFYSVLSKSYLDLFDLHFVNKGPQLQVCNTFVPANIFQEKLGGWPEWFYYKLEVTFCASMFGSYRQTIMFDMKYDPKLVKHISVELQASTPAAFNFENVDQELKVIRNPHKASTENYEVLDGDAGLQVDSTNRNSSVVPGTTTHSQVFSTDEITRDKYISTMGLFLKMEEKARQEELTKYNISGNLELTAKYTIERNYESLMKCCYIGTLYAKINLQKELSEDTKLGRLILRNCQNVLILEVATNVETPRGYICKIADKMKSSIIISIGNSAVKELNLVSGTRRHFVVQFVLDNRHFKEMRAVVESITDTQLDILFPNFSQQLDFSSIARNKSGLFYEGDYTLNENQMQAYNAITNEHQRNMPPLLVIGPFGTGKTHTLAQSLKKILSNNSTCTTKSRVLICTHSNSAADLYITNYLHQWFADGMSSCRPLRIYYADRLVQTVPHIVKRYCLLTGDGMNFRYPTKEEVVDHRVIIVTLSTSTELLDLGLGCNTFTHILLDEACQALETEAIQPLMLAGPNTTVVLAGDYMQLSPELFSTFSQGRAISLLERLYNMYPRDHPCRIVLTENYRSHEVILRFASEVFYEAQLRCASLQPSHLSLYPLTFFAVRGEDVLDENASSFYNMAEVFEVTERVEELISKWPEQWGNYKEDNSIAILTPYADQVTRIRAQLRSRGLGFVSVERVLNVQGKQFRVVFISTVRTQKPWVLPMVNIDLGFFSDPKLLNTALTRAQSLFVCVGCPISLCSTGNCRNIWVEFIDLAAANNSFFGMNHEELKKQLLGLEMTEAYGYNPLAMSTNTWNTATGNDVAGLTMHHAQAPLSPTQVPMQSLTTTSHSSLCVAPTRPKVFSPIAQASPAAMQESNLFSTSNSNPRKEDVLEKINSSLHTDVQLNYNSILEDSLEEKQANDFVDKLLFPNVASIWSDNSGKGSCNNALYQNNNIWAPPSDLVSSLSRQDRSFLASSTSSSSSLVDKLPGAIQLNSNYVLQQPTHQHSSLSNFLTECTSNLDNHQQPLYTNTLTRNSNSMTLPLHELNFNSRPSTQSSSGTTVQQQLPEQPLNFSVLNYSSGNNFGLQQEEVPHTQMTSFPSNKKLSLTNNDPEIKTSNSSLRKIALPQFPQLKVSNQYQLLVEKQTKTAQQQIYQHQPLFKPGISCNYQNSYDNNSITRASPETSISSSETSDYISSNDFPSLQEAIKGKPEKKQQHKQQQKMQPQQLYAVSSDSPSNNDWVQVKKKKAKVKEIPIPSGEEKIETLVTMGFDKKIAIKALQNTGRNLDQAIEWLLSKAGNHNGEN